MKYYLILGIEFQRYRKLADIHVFLDDRLIDSFYMKRDSGVGDMLPHVDHTWYKKYNRRHWLERDDWIEIWKTRPKYFKVYCLDEKDLNNNLEIKVDNSQSNYTNGFMTKSSLIKFSMIGLVPKKLLQNKGEGLMKVLTKFDNGWDKCLARKNIQPRKVSGVFSQSELDLRERIRPSWPTADHYTIKRDNEKWEKSGLRSKYDWIGGSFTLRVPIKTKHKIKVLESKGNTQYGFFTGSTDSIVMSTCKPLLNIYNEDQRSNNT